MWKKLTLDHSGHCKTLHKQRLTFDEDWFSPEDPPNRALQWYSFSTWWNGVIYNFYIWKSVHRVSTDLTKAITVIWFLKSVNSLMEFHMTYISKSRCTVWALKQPFPCVDTLVLPVMSYHILQCPDLWSLWGHKALCLAHVALFLFSARSLQLWFLAWGLPLLVLSVFWFSPEFSLLLACVLKI